jgi:putative addiction module component (TIGR02574 family)
MLWKNPAPEARQVHETFFSLDSEKSPSTCFSAFCLSPIDRAELIERLFLSFDKTADLSVDEAWKTEIESRIDAYDSGKISASPASEVFNRITI